MPPRRDDRQGLEAVMRGKVPGSWGI